MLSDRINTNRTTRQERKGKSRWFERKDPSELLKTYQDKTRYASSYNENDNINHSDGFRDFGGEHAT